jgi:hypothetical protein
MRIIISAVIGIMGAVLLAPMARAVVTAPGQEGDGLGQIIVPVAEGCGIGWHWVGGYRDRYGHWIPGHCVRN